METNNDTAGQQGAESELAELADTDRTAEEAIEAGLHRLDDAERQIEVAREDLREAEHDLERREHELVLKIGTPNGAFRAVFPKAVTVADVIEAAIKEKKLDGKVDQFELHHGDKLLEPTDRTVISFGVESGDTLLLTATGSGV